MTLFIDQKQLRCAALLAVFFPCLAVPGLAGEVKDQPSYERFVQQRLQAGIESMADRPSPFKGVGWDLRYALARRLAGRETDSAPLNKAVLASCAAYTLNREAAPTTYNDPRPEHELFALYLASCCQGFLTPHARDAIEEVCWKWVYRHSFLKDPLDAKGKPFPMNNPTKSVWFITGSENHDAHQRACNLLSLQILMRAGAPYGPDVKLYDGFTVSEHYRTWVSWYREFFRGRLREGLDCEIAHPSSYGASTIGSFYSIAHLTDSAELRQAAYQFLTVYWAHVACEFEPRTGIRAGIASTRCYKFTWNQTGASYWARALLYAYGWTDVKTEASTSGLDVFMPGYQPPEILRAIASDPNREPYLATTRRFGRGTGWQRGVYQVLFDDGEAHNSYLRRDIWYTKDYTLSSLSFDPARDYIELVNQSRITGVTFSHDMDDRLVVYAGNTPVNSKVEYKMPTSCGVNGLLGPDCLIVARDPNAKTNSSNSTRVFISAGALWTNRVEEGGWLFTRAGEGFAALRIAGDKGYALTPSPWKNGYYLDFKDIWAPVVIQTGQAAYFAHFEAFKAAVRAKPFTYADGKLTYTALDGTSYASWSNSKNLPLINGKPLNLNPPKTYDSPYLSMEHGSDTVTLRYPGHPDVLVTCGPDKPSGKAGSPPPG